MSKRQDVGYVVAAAVLLSILFAQAMTAIPRLSITFDEDVHISTGYAILRTGDLRLVEDHPPLLEMWMSWPLLLSPQMPDPWEMPTWELGDRRLFVRNETWSSLPIDSWVIPPRIPITWLALVLGAFIFRWASDWFGHRAGLLALALFTFSPNILAHSTLATLDLGVTTLMFLTMYGLQRLLTRPTWPTMALTGLSLGLAMAAKISALILLPLSVGMMLLSGIIQRRKPGHLVVHLGVYLGTAFLTWWAVHLFQFAPLPDSSIPLPAPTYWNALRRVAQHVSGGDLTYLLGETYRGGRWYYFPIVFALKTPLTTLLLLGTALWVTLRRPKHWTREIILASLPVSYLVISLSGSINLGYRHILPILPFAYLSIARLAAPLSHSQPNTSRFTFDVLRLTLYALLLWQALGTLLVWPFHLTYFNEIAGGPRNGYRYLADSNVDWGQASKALRDYLDDHPWPDAKLSSFTFFIRPELYGVEATPLPPLPEAPATLPNRFNPHPGTYVISASTLRGIQLADAEMFNWFWHREPDDVVANALLVYHVSEPDPRPTWLAQCAVPVASLTPQDVEMGFGRDVDELRLAYFDCTQSWLYPDGGASAGWYVLHREVAAGGHPFVEQQASQAKLSFEQRIPSDTPPLTILEWSPAQPVIPANAGIPPAPVWVAPAEGPPQQAVDEGTPVAPPVPLDGPLTFLGYETLSTGEGVTLLTWWQVTAAPSRPFSLMGHLLDEHGRPVAVGDGLGVSLDQLRVGDVLVQRHDLALPSDAPAGQYWLQTGVYWLDTLERWPVLVAGAAAEDRIVLTPLEVP